MTFDKCVQLIELCCVIFFVVMFVVLTLSLLLVRLRLLFFL